MKQLIPYTLLLLLVTLGSCRSEFETVRLSNDPELILKKAFAYYDDGEWFKSQTLIEQAIPFYRGRPESEEMFYRYANTFYEMQQYILAGHWFQNFSNTYPNSVHRQESDWLKAYSSYRQSPSFRLDQTNSDAAIAEFQTFANTYPGTERAQKCNEIIDDLRGKKEKKSFEEGVLYYNLGQFQAAVKSFETTLIDFPESGNNEEIRYYIVESNFQLAENSIYQKKRERYTEAIEVANQFLARHGNSDRADNVRDIITSSNKRIKSLKDDKYQR